MLLTNPHVSIIILNWNGWQDTIECLESVLKLNYDNFNVILIDNSSSDGSPEKIVEWARASSDLQIDTLYDKIVLPPVQKPVRLLEYADLYARPPLMPLNKNGSVLLVRNRTNYGFALANNQGMDIAEKVYESKYYFLLNNDTIIETNAVSDLVNIMDNNDEIMVSQSTISSYDENKIVNAGGKILSWGQTRHYKSIQADEMRNITFVNGCALFVRSDIINKYGKLSEKFFHGEEDFEFSMRMNKHNLRMVCSGGSRVYHKVGISVKKLMKDYERRTFLFALNRTVDLKDYYPKCKWSVWRFFTLMYFIYLFWIKYRVQLKRTLFLISKVYKYSDQLTEVQKSTIDRIYKELNLT